MRYQKVSRALKKKLAAGGSAKDGLVMLQGDHREAAKENLVRLGYSAANIEVQ